MTYSKKTALQRRAFRDGKWPQKKTVDVGCNGVTVSADPNGGIYQIQAPNEKYGMMMAAIWGQFDPKNRTDEAEVQRYQKTMERALTRRGQGFGLYFDFLPGPVVIKHDRHSLGSRVYFEYRNQVGEYQRVAGYQIPDFTPVPEHLAPDRNLFVQTVLEVRGDGSVIQASRASNVGNKTCRIKIYLDLGLAVSRASYAQQTGCGEVEMPKPTNVFKAYKARKTGNDIFIIDNDSLCGRLAAHAVFYNDTKKQKIPVDPGLFPQDGKDDDPPRALREPRLSGQSVSIGPDETLTFAVIFRPEDTWVPDGETRPPPSALDLDADASSATKLLPAGFFAHDDGVLRPPKVAIQRHIRELAGYSPDKSETMESTILWANVNYAIGCCSVPIPYDVGEPSSRSQRYAIVADHCASPLGWNRDSYWQLQLLRHFERELDKLLPDKPDKIRQYRIKICTIIARHVLWVYDTAMTEFQEDDRINYFWRRSYLINGQPEDGGAVFQLDAQCYPFLELCDFYEFFRNTPAARVHERVKSIFGTKSFRRVLTELLQRQDPKTGLFRADGKPADDDTGGFSFHLSSNILLWHTLNRLVHLLNLQTFKSTAIQALTPRFSPGVIQTIADKIRDGVMRYFPSRRRDDPDKFIFACGFDPSKAEDDPARHRQYHDGSDMPTLYAQEWGFLKSINGDVDTDHEAWRQVWENTMEWAFTPDPRWEYDQACRIRTPAYNSGYSGTGNELFSGLGSDHTISEGPGALGFFQEWKYAQMVRDKERERKAWEKIKGSMQWDGTFPEAVDIYSGQCTSKAWFSWPGAMIAENLIDTVIEQVQTRIATSPPSMVIE